MKIPPCGSLAGRDAGTIYLPSIYVWREPEALGQKSLIDYDMVWFSGCMAIPANELRLLALAAMSDPDSELALWQGLMRKLGLRNHHIGETVTGDGIEWGYYPVVKDLLNNPKCSWYLREHPIAYLRSAVKKNMYRAGLWVESGRWNEVPRRKQEQLEAKMKPVSQFTAHASDGSEKGYQETFDALNFNSCDAAVVQRDGRWIRTGNPPCQQSSPDEIDAGQLANYPLNWRIIGEMANLDGDTIEYLLDRAEGIASKPSEAIRKRLQRAMPELRKAILKHVADLELLQRLGLDFQPKAA